MRGSAYAKVNLALAVYPAAADGFHPLRGIFQSISLSDTVSIEPASSDDVEVSNDEAPSDDTNLAWVAFDSVRRAVRMPAAARLSIDKRIPAGAGLGGGSADAACVIGLMRDRHGLDDEMAMDIAASIGSDVPFALTGGTVIVEGRGDRLDPQPPLTGFALCVVVPPFSLETPAVFNEWDRIGEPIGEPVPDDALPPILRGGQPIRNDLYPAALSLDKRIGDWRDELGHLWGTSVSMTGSGSALFAFFESLDEATSAAEAVDLPVRAAEAVSLVDRGWEQIDG
jgi:4-diphosphocytidyl-2-C-methyl-D-erythritol kinase